MHSFDHRINQLLDSVADMTTGHRERLVRPLRQDDVVCWESMADERLDAVMKASMRIVAHELLDQMCFQMEAALTRCRTDSQRLLLMALVAQKMPESASLLFRDGDQTSGVSYPGAETVVLETDAVVATSTTAEVSATSTAAVSRVDVLVESIRCIPFCDADGSSPTRTRSVAIVVDSPQDERSRQFTAGEVHILAFSAAEIAENPFQCAKRVHDYLR